MSAARRRERLIRFAETALGGPLARVEPASADASFRSYWRLRLADDSSLLAMDAPPAQESIETWLEVGARLRRAGLHAPAVHAVDRAQGFVLMEDLGRRTYLQELDETSADDLYGEALEALLRMQQRVPVADLPPYDRARLVAELELMPAWFLRRHLGFEPNCEEWDVLEAAFTFLLHAALEQPRAFVHRDYHSRNLLICPPLAENPEMLASPGVIDFQDAVAGPLTYDLVSLLRDCYIEWPPERVAAWSESHRRRLLEAGLLDAAVDARRFRRWFDLMGLQRHIKVLGIFCRLCYRDGKAGYLDDLPLVWRYVISVARAWPALGGLVDLLERARDERDLRLPRAATAR